MGVLVIGVDHRLGDVLVWSWRSPPEFVSCGRTNAIAAKVESQMGEVAAAGRRQATPKGTQISRSG